MTWGVCGEVGGWGVGIGRMLYFRMTNTLFTKVQETIKHYKMLKYGDTVLVAVSSGPDSVCLLHILKELQGEYNLSLHIAHLNHGFRGEEAETFLMRVLRGSGSHGLSGIPPVREKIIRPIIGVFRDEISEYLSFYN